MPMKCADDRLQKKNQKKNEPLAHDKVLCYNAPIFFWKEKDSDMVSGP
jgi:hypothetical protein